MRVRRSSDSKCLGLLYGRPEGASTDDLLFLKSLTFCFQLCTVAHFFGFMPLPWFSSLIDKTDLSDFVSYVCRRWWGGGDFVCLFEKNISHCH
jgi:hypothetical protein